MLVLIILTMILVDVLLDLISLMVGGYWSFMITDRNKKKRKEKEVSLNMLWFYGWVGSKEPQILKVE